MITGRKEEGRDEGPAVRIPPAEVKTRRPAAPGGERDRSGKIIAEKSENKSKKPEMR